MAINDNELYALKGKQVKDLAQRLVLKGDKPITGSGSPTTSTEGEVGQLYIDNTNAKLYICVEIVEESGEPDSYVWQEVGAGGGVGVTALTSADYNWNYQTQTATDPNCVAVWLLDSGIYIIAEQSLKIAQIGSNISSAVSENFGEMFTIAMGAPGVTGVSLAKCYTKLCDRALAPQSISGGIQYLRTWEYMSFFDDNGVKLVDRAVLFDDSLNDLSGNTLTGPLSAVKGKEIEDLIHSLVIKNAGAPTTSTVGTVGQLIEDTTNGKLYICTDATNPYVWTEVGAGGGPTVVQTTGTSTTDVMSQNAVTNMVYSDTTTKYSVRIGETAAVSTNDSNSGVALGYHAQGTGGRSVAVGAQSVATGNYAVALGGSGSSSRGAYATGINSIALGNGSEATQQGQMDISVTRDTTTTGYNSSNYRLLTGLYDPQSAHDAATKGYVDSVAPVITMTSTDPGEGQPLAANNFIAVY